MKKVMLAIIFGILIICMSRCSSQSNYAVHYTDETIPEVMITEEIITEEFIEERKVY